MDSLFFKTNNKDALFKELGIPEEYDRRIFESENNWVLEWLGKLPEEFETKVDESGLEYQEVVEWKDGEYFNIYLNGQDNMDFFTQKLVSGKQLLAPETPNAILL